MDRVEAVVDENAKVHFRFQFTTQPGRHVLQLEDVSKAYSEKEILKHTNITMERGDKIALIGANGKGKSTLLRVIAGTEPIDGVRRLGHNVLFTFYAQHQLESLNVENTILDELKYANPTKTETECRTILGCFLFVGDDVFKKIKVLSGGEKSRVALAKVLVSEANFLLLDEPTNHLDMQSVNILIQALRQYEGSFVVVSHDRFFVEAIAEKIWYIEEKEVKEYPGTYQEYEWWREEREEEAAAAPAETVVTPQRLAPALAKNTSSGTSHQQKTLQKKITQLEQEIDELEKRKKEAEAQLADTAIYSDAVKLAEANKKYTEVQQKIASATDAGENAMMEMEELG